MKRNLFLAAGLMLAAGWVGAQEKTDGTWQAEAPPSEPHGKTVRDEPAALRVQDMTMDELHQRLAEYEAGKRDDRDGYIILNQLWFNYQAQRRTTSPDFQAIVSKRDGLLKKRPELGNLEDFRLSDKINHDKMQKDNETRKLEILRAWTPKDTDPKSFFAHHNRVVIKYQYRIEFFKFPAHFSFFQEADSSWKMRDSRAPNAPPQEVEIPKRNPLKILSFKNAVEAYPRNTLKNPSSRLLVCTRYQSYYSPTTSEERAAVKAKGFRNGMPWKNEAGERENFCGIVGINGVIVYEFPQVPDQLLLPVDIVDAGSRAAVLVGKEISETSFESGETARGIGNFYEMLVWEYPNKLRRVKLKDNNAPDHVWHQRFINREY